jgi:uncharacterized membrane protein
MIKTAFNNLKNAVPMLQSKWWTTLLIASLMANLLVLGLVAGKFLGEHGLRGQEQQSVVQLIPREFLQELPVQRRHELMQALRGDREDFKLMRQKNAAAALELASVLENPNYDSAATRTVIQKFATGRESLANNAASAVEQIIDKLSVAERAQLATAIRNRNNRDWKRD